MSELDEEWKRRMDEAMRRAAASGQDDVGDYLRLRQANDEARSLGISWLLELFNAAVGTVVRKGAGINIERTPSHSFSDGGATMVGEQIVFRNGVRALTIEVGYPRTPQDGFITGGGLARANVRHFGDARAGIELLLVRAGTNDLQWHEINDGKHAGQFTESDAQRHVIKLLGTS